jgi:hypothetical protein
VAVEKGTKAVISVNFSVYGRRTFNNLRTNFAVEIPLKRLFQQPRLITPRMTYTYKSTQKEAQSFDESP